MRKIPPVLDKRGRPTHRRPARSDARCMLRRCPTCGSWVEFGTEPGVVAVACCGQRLWHADLPANWYDRR